jgi:RNA polymerase sigma factor (TIGR02999 family)
MLRRPGEWPLERLGEGCSSTAFDRLPTVSYVAWGNPASRGSTYDTERVHIGRFLRVFSPPVTFGGMSDVTRLLDAAAAGDPKAADELLPLVYDELRQLAAARMAEEKPGQTLQATALVHEAYLRLVGGNASSQWNGRGHFFGAAAEAMRRILVESARRKNRFKRGGDRQRVDLEDHDVPAEPPAAEILAIDEALTRLTEEDPATAQVVQLHFFAGLPIEEVAEVLGISRATAYRQWSYARAWLRCAIGGDEEAAE